jgi:hypothetical protein
MEPGKGLHEEKICTEYGRIVAKKDVGMEEKVVLGFWELEGGGLV